MRKLNYKLSKNFLLKDNIKKNYIHRFFIKSLFKEFINIPHITISFLKLNYKENYKYSQFRTRCLLTGKVRGTLKKFMLSRMFFKKLALNGYIIGVKKASW